jgi:dihydropteroate synthase
MTLVMGILNVTPDSFSDGGKYLAPENAIARGLEMMAEGVDIIDVGGESTRPGATRVTEAEELARVLPVITELKKRGAKVSVDTMRSNVAAQSGADIINDVSGGKSDPKMFETVAGLGVPYVLMHWRGHSNEMDQKAIYNDVVTEVIDELLAQVELALVAGIKKENLILDPGLGFAKNVEQNWEIVNSITEFKKLGYPLLIGGSRKRFLNGSEAESIKLTALMAKQDIWAVRTHSVAPHKAAIKNL